MTGFTVTDEVKRQMGKAVQYVMGGSLDLHDGDAALQYGAAAYAALEAAARTAQPAPLEPTDEEQQFIDMALLAVDSKSAGHWPTVAGYLADEVRRMRAIIALVPQPTPVADRQQLAEVLDPEAFDPHRERSKHTAAVIQWAARQHMAREGADRLLAAGVFKTEAEVRATAIEEVAEAYLYDDDRDSQLPGYVALIECAAAIRAGGQA